MKSHPFLPNSDPRIVELMLKEIGLDSIEELFEDIRSELQTDLDLKIPEGLSEVEVERYVEETLSKNRVGKCFLGGGVWPHHIPSAVDEVASRTEFYTSYTPYQPEISQGMLQTLFEYQSLICDLTEMDAANSSMYDWATALGEAARMASRVKRRRRIIVSRNVGPERVDTLKTYCSPVDIDVKIVDFDHKSGCCNIPELTNAIDDTVAGIYVENPNFFGIIEDSIVELAEAAHKKDALFIVGVDPTSLGLIKAPGRYGADIVVGEGQPLGIPMNYGGPLLGIFAVRGDQSFIRQMPGRLIGMTTTREGIRRGFTMVLQTREQHIRREAATSNICTNEALLAISAAVYLSLLGPEGLKDLARAIMANSHYAAKLLNEIEGVEAPYFHSIFFKDFTVKISSDLIGSEELFQRLYKDGILGGLPLSRYFDDLRDVSLFSVTEVHTPDDIKVLTKVVRKILGG